MKPLLGLILTLSVASLFDIPAGAGEQPLKPGATNGESAWLARFPCHYGIPSYPLSTVTIEERMLHDQNSRVSHGVHSAVRANHASI